MKTKKPEVNDFRSKLAGRKMYLEILPAVVGMIMVRTGTSYAATMRALCSMNGRFGFIIERLGRTTEAVRLKVLAHNLDEFKGIIFEVPVVTIPTPGVLSGLRQPSVRVQSQIEMLKGSPEVLELPIRVHNALRKAGFKTLDQVVSMTHEELLEVKGIGVNAVAQISNELRNYGMRLSMKGSAK